MTGSGVRVVAVQGLPEIGRGDELGAIIVRHSALDDGDIVAVSQKAVSKAEGRTALLSAVSPGPEALRLARECDKDSRLVELILAESRAVIRVAPGVLITETRSGLVCANAGIDSSNLAREGEVALLPEDPDRSARRIRAEIRDQLGSARPASRPLIGVVVTDSFGRPWRLGQTDVAIGCAGLEPLDDWRGRRDASGRELSATLIAVADQIAAAADLARTKTSRTPAVIVRGLSGVLIDAEGPGAAAMRRAEGEDLFR